MPTTTPGESIPVTRTQSPRPRPQPSELGFGRFFTDHMFVMEHESGRGWRDLRVVPYGNLSIDPAAGALQYGQSIFEGLKVFRVGDDGLTLFRPEVHAARFNNSARRLCMPEVAPEMFLAAARALINVDREWVPSGPGTALYLRPTMIGTEPFLGVRPSGRYTFFVLGSPVGGYWHGPPRALRLWVEREYVRAARGGIGFAKAGANYAISLLAAERAKERGFDQVLWLDGVHRRYVEEVGTMNLFARIGDTVITPALDGTILPGVTRDSTLTLLKTWGIPFEERALALDELVDAQRAGTLREVWGTGTAAVVSPVGELAWEGGSLAVPPPELALRLQTAIQDIQFGRAEDPHGWRVSV